MASATLSINVSAADLEKLQQLPAQIQNVVNEAGQALQAIRSGGNPANAFSGLLGNLNNLAGQASQSPDLSQILQPVQQLLAKLPTQALGDLQAAVQAIEDVLQFFGPLKDTLLSGNIEQAVKEAVDRVLDQASHLFQPNDETNGVLADFAEFLSLFRTLTGWGQTRPDPQQVGNLLSRAIIGIPHDLLADAANRLETVLHPLSQLLPHGSELTVWRGAAAPRVTFWSDVLNRFSGGAAIDWARLEKDLQAEAQHLLDISTARDRLLSVTLGNLNAINLGGLAGVHDAMRAIPPVNPPQLTTFIDGIRDHLKGIVDFLTDWNPTPDEVRATVRAFVDRFADEIGQSPLGQLRALLVDFQHRILLAIEALPFRDLASEAEDKLREIARTIDVLDPDILRRPIHQLFEDIENKLHQFSADTVKNAIGQIWQGVSDALHHIQDLLESVRTTIQGAIATVQHAIEQAQPALNQVSQAVASIKATLDGFDLSQPASAIIDELHKLRDTVASLDLSSLPGPAVSAVKAGADMLKSINVTAAVTPPLNDVLNKIDPTPIIQEAAAAIDTVTGKLRLLDPATIVQNLDAPINDLLNALGNLGPDGIQTLLHAALTPVENAIRSLDIEHLFAPLMQLFAELTAKVDAILNPDVIFHPLETAFQPVIDLIDKVEPTNLVSLLNPHADAAAGQMRNAVTPPSAMGSAGSLLKDALQPVVSGEDELFGYRPGDMLIPVIDLHHRIAKAFDDIDDALLEPAAQVLRDALHGRLDALHPVSLEARISGSLAGVHAEFAPGAVGERLQPAEDAFHNAVVAIAAAAAGALSPADSAIATRVLGMLPDLDPLTIIPDATSFDGVVNATAQVQGNLDLSGIRSGFAALGAVDALVPAFLRDAALSADSVRAAIHALDPAPVRVEINQIFDDLGHKIVGLKDALLSALDEFFAAAERFLLPITPGAVIQLASELHAALKDQLLAFSPATFKDEVKLIFDVVKKPIAAFSPAILITELDGLRNDLINTLEGLIASLLPDPTPFNALIAEIGQFKPSVILAPVTQALQPLSQLIATLDVNTLLQPLIDAIARIKGEVPQVVAQIEAALDDVLSAFPDGGPASASVNVSASAA